MNQPRAQFVPARAPTGVSALVGYLDFEIRAGDGSGGNYPVAVGNSPVIKPSATTSVPIGDPGFQNYLQALLPERLKLNSAVRLQPLTDEQVTRPRLRLD